MVCCCSPGSCGANEVCGVSGRLAVATPCTGRRVQVNKTWHVSQRFRRELDNVAPFNGEACHLSQLLPVWEHHRIQLPFTLDGTAGARSNAVRVSDSISLSSLTGGATYIFLSSVLVAKACGVKPVVPTVMRGSIL